MHTIALVTGANRGIGLGGGETLARSGHTVVMTGRNLEALTLASITLKDDGLDVDVLVLDVNSTASIRCAVQQVCLRHGRLDILVNSAGILPEARSGATPTFADPNDFAVTFQTNLFGAVAVIEAFLPLLHQSLGGRIVNISSTMGSLADQENPASPYYGAAVPAYRASKAALNSVTIELSKQLAGSNIKVTSVCPGFVQTDLTPVSREQAPLTAAQAATVVLAAATLPAGAASGTFVDAAGTVAW